MKHIVTLYRAREFDEVLLSKDELRALAIEVERQLFGAAPKSGDLQGAYKRRFKALLVLLRERSSASAVFARRLLDGSLAPAALAQLSLPLADPARPATPGSTALDAVFAEPEKPAKPVQQPVAHKRRSEVSSF